MDARLCFSILAQRGNRSGNVVACFFHSNMERALICYVYHNIVKALSIDCVINGLCLI